MKDLIVVKQLPVIEENLKKLSEEIQQKVDNATSLICSEETVKEVKAVRAELNNEFKELEAQRKFVKEEILAPYQAFEEIYKKYVSDNFKTADVDLKNKIDSIENEIKNNCKDKLKEYFEEYRLSKNLDESYLNFEELNINITLGLLTEKKELTKKAKEEVTTKVDFIITQIDSISTMDNSNEVLAEYLKHKDLAKAIKDVNDRHYILNLVAQKEEEKKNVIAKEQEVIKQVDKVVQSPVIEEEVHEFNFKVKCTISKAKELKQFLIIGGYDYE